MKPNFLRVAFTLIELLVVIAIVGILAALTMPALLGAKNRAYESDCANNLSQIGKAMGTYTQTENRNTPNGGPAIADVYRHSPTGMTRALSEYGMESNSLSWYCKRQLKFLKTDAETFRKNFTRVSYFYWGWSTNSGAGVDFLGTKSAWSGAWATNKLKGAVFLSCPFYTNTMATLDADILPSVVGSIQFHLATDTEAPFREAGTPVLITGGAVQKVGPSQP